VGSDVEGFLARALEAEWRGRQQRGIDMRLRMARFPWLKTLEPCDCACQPSLDLKVVRELAGLSVVERAENVVLLGPPGVGKTHLACLAADRRSRWASKRSTRVHRCCF
jgi:DNA replication protein DnaC